ncbi:MAG: HEAT repeat domain-containing protein [Limisphaerales bacterium]
MLKTVRAKDPPPVVLKFLDLARNWRVLPIRYRYASTRNEEARYAFETLGPSAASAVPALIEIYQQDVSPDSRRCAASALASIGPSAQAAVPVLLRDFTHTNGQVRFDAVTAVSHIGGDPNLVLPAMRSALKDPKLEVRWNASAALLNLGARARPAVPDLLVALNDPATQRYQGLKEQLETALWLIAPEKVGKLLVVEDATPMVAGGVTTETLDVMFNGERKTLIASGRPVPCQAQFWHSAPRGPLTLYRSASKMTGTNHFLGEFEVMGIPPPPSNANVSLLCIIADQQILLSARDNNRSVFLEIRRIK